MDYMDTYKKVFQMKMEDKDQIVNSHCHDDIN